MPVAHVINFVSGLGVSLSDLSNASGTEIGSPICSPYLCSSCIFPAKVRVQVVKLLLKWIIHRLRFFLLLLSLSVSVLIAAVFFSRLGNPYFCVITASFVKCIIRPPAPHRYTVSNLISGKASVESSHPIISVKSAYHHSHGTRNV